MRRSLVILIVLVSLPGMTSAAPPPTLPLLPRACTPEGPLDVERPASCRRILYKVGPLHVTSGDNLILFGPITI